MDKKRLKKLAQYPGLICGISPLLFDTAVACIILQRVGGHGEAVPHTPKYTKVQKGAIYECCRI